VTVGNLTNEQAQELIAAAQKKRGELLMKEFNTVNDTNIDAFFQKVESMKGDIPHEVYKSLYIQLIRANLASSADAKEPVADALSRKQYIDGIRATVGDDVYYAMLDELKNSIKYNGFGKVIITSTLNSHSAEIKVSANGASENVAINYKRAKDITAEGTEGQIISSGGKLYIYKFNAWNEFTISESSVGGKETAEFLTQILTERYNVGPNTYSQSVSKLPSQQSPAA
jgi:hypothetical protein